MTGLEAVDALMYASYKVNRQLQPQVAPREWGVIFGLEPALRYEARFQEEARQKVEAMLARMHAHLNPQICAECGGEPDARVYGSYGAKSCRSCEARRN